MICSWEKEDFRIYINEKEGINDSTQMKRHNPEDNKFEIAARKRYWEKKNEEWRAKRDMKEEREGEEEANADVQ